MGGAIAGVASGAAGAFGATASNAAGASPADSAKAQQMRRQIMQIETDSGGRLGVSILDTATGFRAGSRRDERFPMCSTFKLLLAGAVLTRTDRGEENLARRVVFSKSQLVANSPATSQHTRERTGSAGMSVAQLCKAAITLSDNTAANLLLATLNGPAGLTAFVRQLGDTVTRLDRNEPTLNEAIPGDPRDTTSPDAMLANLRELLLGERLSTASRAQLAAWLVANETGGARIRAKLPKDWRVGDKTGTGEHGTANDVAILWPPQRAPILVSVYLTGAGSDAARSNAAIANVGALAASLA
ncbi:class A beta-lactamase [Paraburkholderia sp. GAS199]|uniref:class A beta-lactamase n=1 Tax=Paraburkholderia sp. GAS199 TaxID=3035126 RepID=UPI003D2533DC